MERLRGAALAPGDIGVDTTGAYVVRGARGSQARR